jgi:hypothetical protein
MGMTIRDVGKIDLGVMKRTDKLVGFKAPWVIFWVGFALRVVVILVGHTYKVRTDQANFNFGFEAGRIARSVATGHGFANPFNGESGPTAWLPPLYPLLMAAAFKVFGVYTRGAALALLVVDSAFSAAIAPAVYEIAARCFDSRGIARRRSTYAAPVALWSAWIWAVYPAALQYAIHWIWEMSLTACLFAWAIVVVLRLRGVGSEKQGLGLSHPSKQRPLAGDPGREQGLGRAWGLWVVLGVLWGGIALSNASLLLCLPAMMIWIAWPVKQGLGIREQGLGAGWKGWLGGVLGGWALTTVAFALVLAPWVARNERVLHAFVPTRDNFGVELYESTLEQNDGFPWGTTIPLWTGDREFQRYVRMGEVKYSAMRGAEAKARIEARPWRTAGWTLDRFLFFWDGTPHPANGKPVQEYLRQLSYSFISLCGLLGLILVVRLHPNGQRTPAGDPGRRLEGAGLFALVFVLLPLPYYLVTVQPRFRHPMEPLIAVLAVVLFRSAEKIGIRD